MSGFSEVVLEKKLGELNNSQQSIQTLSLWLIHHRKHHATIVNIWYKEFMKAKDSRKLTFVYLANDVIQNSRKKGPEFGKEFGYILSSVFKHMGAAVNDEKTQKSLRRLLEIWGERNIFDSYQIGEFTKSFEIGRLKHDNGEPPAKVPRVETSEETKEEKHDSSIEKLRDRRKSENNETIQFDEEGRKEIHITLSPKQTSMDPPEPEELIKALQYLDDAASSDGNMREKIAQLPPEVSDASLLYKVTDQIQAEALIKMVSDAIQLLSEYNGRLMKEMENRKALTKMLHDFMAAQKELLVQAEVRLQEYKEKLVKIYQVREELQSHIRNLPDLSQLPDVSAGLPPLPSAGDLFSLR